MADADASRARLIYRKETAFDEAIPANPAMTALRFTADTFKAANDTVTSNEIRADRMRSKQLLVGQEVTGGFNFELSYSTYDLFLESILSGAWTSNVLKNGVVAPSSWQFERGNSDASLFTLFKGLTISDFNITAPTRGIVTGDFSFMGTVGAIAGTSALGTGTLTAANTNAQMKSGPGINNILVNGAAIGVGVRELKLHVGPNVRPHNVIDTYVTRQHGRGSFDISGSLSIYFSTAALMTLFLANTSFALSFVISDPASGSYTFLLPNCQSNDDSAPVTAIDTDVIEDFQFKAFFDATEGCAIKITRAVLP